MERIIRCFLGWGHIDAFDFLYLSSFSLTSADFGSSKTLFNYALAYTLAMRTRSEHASLGYWPIDFGPTPNA